MRRLISVVGLVAVAVCADPAPTSTVEGGSALSPSLSMGSESAPAIVFNTQLRAENEPGPVSTSESLGHAQVRILPDNTIEFTVFLNNKADETVTRAHIHKAPAGSNGPIHWDFHEPPADQPVVGDHVRLQGTARPRPAANPSDLRANPAQYYVNVHSALFPGGVVRGQLP
jgi:hypothetical protein